MTFENFAFSAIDTAVAAPKVRTSVKKDQEIDLLRSKRYLLRSKRDPLRSKRDLLRSKRCRRGT